MDANQAVGVAVAQSRGYASTDISAVRCEARVTKYIGHKLFPENGCPDDFHARLCSVIREAETGQRRCHHIEGVPRVAAVGCGIDEQRD